MPFDAPPPAPAVEIVASSSGTSKGLRETDDLQVRADVRVDIGDARFGVNFKNVDGVGGEGQAYAKVTKDVMGFTVTGTGTYKRNSDVVAGYDAQAFEGAVSLARAIGPVATSVTATYSPNDLGLTGESLYVEGAAGLAVADGTVLSAGAGKRWRENGLDYTAWNVGVVQNVAKNVKVDVRYFDTNQQGWAYAERVTASVRFSF